MSVYAWIAIGAAVSFAGSVLALALVSVASRFDDEPRRDTEPEWAWPER